MLKGSCICSKTSLFKPVIRYRNETVFRAYEGTVIGKCIKCGILKTFPSRKNRTFDPVCTKADQYAQRENEFRKLFAPVADAVGQFAPGKRVLDVGCSSGILLSMLRDRGFSCRGLEPNRKACAAARIKLGSAVVCITLPQILKKNRRTFDCVVYNHVLEHIPDVRTELRLIKRILAPGGILIIGVPNTAHAIFAVRGKYWESLLPNEHVWHFSGGYVRRLLESEGFETLHTEYTDDARREYPFFKRVYFLALHFVNLLLGTGEAVLVVSRYNGVTARYNSQYGKSKKNKRNEK